MLMGQLLNRFRPLEQRLLAMQAFVQNELVNGDNLTSSVFGVSNT